MAHRFREQERTLAAVKSGLYTAQAIWEKDDERANITVLAVTQRLRRLYKLGLLERKPGLQDGSGRKAYSYSIPTTKIKEPHGSHSKRQRRR